MYNPYIGLLKYKLRKAYSLFAPGKLVIPDLRYSRREITVTALLKRYGNLELMTFLNVGFRNWDMPVCHWWIKICEANQIDWHILEAFEENVSKTISLGCSASRISHGNILNTEEYESVDCLFFWHGPEHLDKDVFLKTLPKIESKARKLIIFGMPLGEHPQDEIYGNPFEKHVSTWSVKEWTKLGYQVISVYDSKTQPPHITVYKVL